MTAIKVWDYISEYHAERTEVLAALETVFESGRLILGEQVEQFEQEFSGFVGAKHGVGVNSATDALFLALKALGIGAGDEVITVPNTAVPTVSAIAATGATPVFTDIVAGSYLMDVSQIESKVTERTRVILPVHLFGQCVDMSAIERIAAERGLFVIEDCAQAHGAQFQGHFAGSMSDVSAFSFYPTKILGTYGDGGMVVTSNEELAAHVKRLRFYGMEKQYLSLEAGFNSRLDEIHAAILRKKLVRLPGYLARRRHLASRYDTLLNGNTLGLPAVADGNCHAYYLYVCRHPERDRIIALLKERDIHVNISYPWPIHMMPAYSYLGYREGEFPVAELAAKEIFSLPMYPSLADLEQDQVVSALSDILTTL